MSSCRTRGDLIFGARPFRDLADHVEIGVRIARVREQRDIVPERDALPTDGQMHAVIERVLRANDVNTPLHSGVRMRVRVTE